MKKIILTVAAVFAFGLANAQDLKSKKGENYLPEAGDWAISFNANGIFEYVGNAFSGSTAKNEAPSVDFARSNSFVGKKFIDAKTAYRVVANLGFNSNSTTTPFAGGGISGSNEYKESGFDLAFGLGKEWRRGNTRLQGFYGADALLTISSSSTEDTDTAPGFTSSTKTKSGLGLGVGMQGFIGAEYFIFPKMSIGAQYTYGVGVNIQGEGETTESATGTPTLTTKTGKSSGFGIGSVGVASMNLTLHF
jgi:opacity protein-like surface antigen